MGSIVKHHGTMSGRAFRFNPLKTSLFGVVCLWSAWSAGAQSETNLELSELMASNSKTRADEDGEAVDWIEIRNAGPSTVNLEGWTLTDDSGSLSRWAFPSTNLPPGGFLVVNASGKDRRTAGRPLHTNFSLDAAGEYLALVSPEGEVATQFAPAFPAQRSDVSYGLRDGREYFFDRPTPGTANVGGFNEFVADTRFSHDRGFYTAPFDLEITCATQEATIRYTTNGTPPALTNGFTYSGPIRIAGTTVLRAAAFKTGQQPSNVDTQTYLFLDDVIRQSPTGQPPPGWPTSWGSNVRDYGMDPDIVNNARYATTIREDLQTIPSFSVVMDLDDLFNRSRGIYANPGAQGRSWERRCSLELIRPDGTDGFQVDCGIRIRGGFSRSTDNPKHAFRFFFRAEYGTSKLRYPLLSQGGAEEFDGIDLRTFQNYSWSFQGDSRGNFIRDQFNRDTQLELGHDAERGDYFHLYINGQYWGLFNTCERPEASYGETYYGGRKEDYDVVKVESGPYNLVATDGNLQAWTRLYNACKGDLSSDAAYERLLGNNPDGTPNLAYERLLEPDNLIDYMLVILYGGNLDAPISNFLGNTRPNNWYGIRNRTGRDGFRFFVHDAEHTLLNVNENRLGPYPAGDSSVTYSSPQWIWQRLWANAEFRLLVADRAHRHFFNGGALTPAAARERFLRRRDEIDRAVVGESARWGDAKRGTPFTRDDWLNAVNTVLNGFLPQRTDRVVSQLRTRGLYPSVVAPSFNQHGGAVAAGFQVTVQAPAGQTYYTADGSDPRLRGGAVSPTAGIPTQPLTVDETVTVKARTRSGAEWSALTEATFTVIQTYTNVLITELMYHPPEDENGDDGGYEFIELKNVNPFEIDLGGVRFSNGIQYVFPLGSRLGPGQFVVLAQDAARFTARYPGVRLDGVYTGSLNNAGERITLVHAVGTPLFTVSYDDGAPWPEAADGQGFSLVAADPNGNPNPEDARNWRASTAVGGSPRRDDPALDVPPVVINEILTHTDPPEEDAVELYNPTDTPADISHWYLTDERTQPRKYRIPAGTILLPSGYLVLTASEFNASPGAPNNFNLSALGEEVYLYSGNAAGELTGYSDGFSFGAAANGVSLGRWTNSVGEVQFPVQRASSLLAPNLGPQIGPVVLNEIQYQPATGEAEYVELKNLTDQPLELADPQHPENTWRLAGVGFWFPPGSVIPPQGLVVVAGSDAAVFRARHGVPPGVPVFGPFPGSLQNNGELLELQRPDAPDLVTNEFGQVNLVVPYLTVDAVRYNDKLPWPTNAAGLGPSLERVTPSAYGNDPASWRSSPGLPSPGLENDGNRPPLVQAGRDQELEAAAFPAVAQLSGTASDDGLPTGGAGLWAAWQQLSGPGRVVFTEADRLATEVHLPGAGTYILRLTVGDGQLERSAETSVIVRRPATDQTVVPAGSEWRYLDNGSNQGTAWRLPGFNDSTWRTGRARLGYGGDGEATVIQSGPSNNKFITAYFRRTFAIASPGSVTALKLKVARDDGVVVYLNGEEVMRNGMPEGAITYTTRANVTIGGADETTFLEQEIDPALLRAGENLLAAEVHQVNPTSSDLGFDLELEASVFPENQPPSVLAGPDVATAVNEPALLRGSFQDDALPNPPGVATLAWTVLSGPGQATFADGSAWVTWVRLDAPGAYVLRLSATDGERGAFDDVTVTVEGAVEPPQIQSLRVVGGPSPALELVFTGAPGSYAVLERSSLTEGEWQTAGTLVIPASQSSATTAIPIEPEVPTRFYRVARTP